MSVALDQSCSVPAIFYLSSKDFKRRHNEVIQERCALLANDLIA